MKQELGQFLSKQELQRLSQKMRGRRVEIARRAGVGLSTVNNTLCGFSQNILVLRTIAVMIQEMKPIIPAEVQELREILKTEESVQVA